VIATGLVKIISYLLVIFKSCVVLFRSSPA
jgi:hypothetical protein